MKIRYNHWIFKLIRNYDGIVIYPWVLFKQDKTEVSDTLFRHELEHVYQIQREGWFCFHMKYFWYLLKYGYWNNPYEVSARKAQTTPLTKEESEIR